MSLLPSSTTGDVVVPVGHPSTGYAHRSRGPDGGRTVPLDGLRRPRPRRGARRARDRTARRGRRRRTGGRGAGPTRGSAGRGRAGLQGRLPGHPQALPRPPRADGARVGGRGASRADGIQRSRCTGRPPAPRGPASRRCPVARAVVRARGAPPRRPPAVRRGVAEPLRNGGRCCCPGAATPTRCTPDERRPSRRGRGWHTSPTSSSARCSATTLPGWSWSPPRAAGGRPGFTATSLTSVSMEPPMVSFAVARSASAWPTVAQQPTGSAYTSWPTTRTGSPRRSPPAASTASQGVRWHPGPAG